MKRDDEEKCKKVFSGFLEHHLKDVNFLWDDGDEPPDYYLTIDSKKFAVEVTDLLEKNDLDRSQLPMIAIRSFLKDFEEEVKREAIERDILQGYYLVTFNKPIVRFNVFRNEIKDRILDFTRETRNMSAPQEKNFVFREKSRQELCIQKIHDEQNNIAFMPPVRAKWETEVEGKLKRLMFERVNEKIKKLSNIVEPKILLLFDRYLFESYKDGYQDYINYISSLQNVDFYELVFLIRDDAGFILFSKWKDMSKMIEV